MQTYIGYGFDTTDIKAEDWSALAEKYDKEAFDDWKESLSSDEDICECISDFIDSMHTCKAEYLASIINGEEAEAAGTNYIVSTYDDVLVFDSVRFADDSKRSQYIRTVDDFVKMIGKYVPLQDLTFGNLYEGTDWIDPVFFME